jgi:membrane-associated PAP2 superfamily phosphatase
MFRQLRVGIRPDINYLVVTLVVGDETHVVVRILLALLASWHLLPISSFSGGMITSVNLNDKPPLNASSNRDF